MKKKVPERVRLKTGILIREGKKTPAEAYAEAWNMYKEHRLGQHGEYKRVKKSR